VYIPPTLLASGPLGGVGTGGGGVAAGLLAAPADQIVLKDTNATLLDSLVRMTVLTSSGATYATGMGGDFDAVDPSTFPVVDGGVSLLQSLFDTWQKTIDTLFGMPGWFDHLPASSPLSDMTGSSELTMPLVRDHPQTATIDDAFATSGDDSMFLALATIGAFGLSDRRRRRGCRRRHRMAQYVNK
jgi:hypothetical protein